MSYARPRKYVAVESANVDISGKLDSSAIGNKSLDGNFKTLKVMDTNVITDVSGKLNSTAIGDKSLDGNFKTLKVMDTAVITDVSGKLDKSGGTMNVGTSGLTINTSLTTNIISYATPLSITWPAASAPSGISQSYISLHTSGYGGFIAGGNISGTGGFCILGVNQNNLYNEYMRINTSGHVGIGTNNPTSKLHVSGSANITGALTLGGGVVSDGTTFTATEVKNALNLTKSGGTMGGTLTLNTNGISADSTTFTAAQVKNALSVDISGKLNSTAIGDKSLDGNFKTLKVMDAAVITDISTKLNTTAVGDKSLDGNFKTLKVMDAAVITDISTKLNTTAVGDKSLDGNFKTLKVMDTAVITDVSGKLDKTGGTMTGSTYLTGSNFIQFGSGVSGKHADAGKIGYQLWNTGLFEIVGAGTGTTNRNVAIYDNLSVSGTFGVGGLLTLSSSGLRTDSSTFTATEVKNALNLTKSGGTMGGTLTLNTNGISADSTTFTAAQVKNALSLHSYNTVYTGTTAAGIMGDSYFTMAAIGNPPAGIYAFTITIEDNPTGIQENTSAAGIFYKSPSYMPGLVTAFNGLSCRADSSQIWITNPQQSAVTYRLTAKKIF